MNPSSQVSICGLVWHALIHAGLLILPAWLLFRQPFWSLPQANTGLLLALAGTYVAAALTPGVTARFLVVLAQHRTA